MNINPFIDLFAGIINLYAWILLFSIIISWLVAFGIINRFNPLVAKIIDVLNRITEPVLRLIRPYMPDLGGIDISPIIIFLLLRFITSCMYTYLYVY